MKKGMMKKGMALVLALVLVGALAACGGSASSAAPAASSAAPASTAAEAPADSTAAETSAAGTSAVVTKVGALIPGSINDGGWGTMGYECAKGAAELFGAEFSYTETSSPQDAIDALIDYGEQGYSVVFCHSYDYQDACDKVGADYPDTQFVTSGGTVMTENITPIYIKSEQAAYLCGVVAAKMTTTKKIGCVGSEETPSISKTLKGFAQGVTDTDPTCEVTITYIGSANDTGKAREATIALINSGVDMVFASANAAAHGVFQAVDEYKDQGVMGFGSYARITETYPDCFIADMISDYEPVFLDVVTRMDEGTFEPGQQFFADIFNGGCKVLWNEKMEADIPDDVKAAYEQAIEDFRADKITINIGEY